MPIVINRPLALALILVAAGPACLVAQCPDGTPPPCAGRARPAAPPPTSVAVLYFDNASHDSADAYLAAGLTEQTITQLGAVERLTVASRFAVKRFRGAEQEPAAMGRALNVSYLVTGSVQRAGNRLRVGVELVRASSGVRVWGESYDRTDADLLRVQDDIAGAVASNIVGRLLPGEQRAVTARATRNSVAYDRLLRGNFQLARREPRALQQALREYQAALDADPRYIDALARSAYAYANALDNEYDIGLARDTMVARGVALAERALRLDSTSSDAWLARAYVRMGEEPVTMRGVRPLFERAIALNRRSAEAHHQFASYLGYMGDTATARTEMVRALEFEPGRPITWMQLAELELRRGRWPEVLRLSDSALAYDPEFVLAHVMRFFASRSVGDTTAARASLRVIGQRPGFEFAAQYFGVFLTASVARDSSGMQYLRAAAASLNPTPTTPGVAILCSFTAAVLAQIGERDLALAVLERAFPRGVRLHDGMRNPDLDPIRNDPRFIRLWNETRAPGQVW